MFELAKEIYAEIHMSLRSLQELVVFLTQQWPQQPFALHMSHIQDYVNLGETITDLPYTRTTQGVPSPPGK